jgi:hypothetical protein
MSDNDIREDTRGGVMSEHEHGPDELSPNYRTGDAVDEPLEQDRDEPIDEIEEAVTEARSADPRIAEPPP